MVLWRRGDHAPAEDSPNDLRRPGPADEETEAQGRSRGDHAPAEDCPNGLRDEWVKAAWRTQLGSLGVSLCR